MVAIRQLLRPEASFLAFYSDLRRAAMTFALLRLLRKTWCFGSSDTYRVVLPGGRGERRRLLQPS